MQRRELLAEIARELGVPEEVVERTVYALLERFGEGPPSLTAQLVSELRGIAHQIGRLEGEFGEFRRVAEPRLEQIGELAQRLERLEGEFGEFRRSTQEGIGTLREEFGERLESQSQAFHQAISGLREEFNERLESSSQAFHRVISGLREEFGERLESQSQAFHQAISGLREEFNERLKSNSQAFHRAISALREEFNERLGLLERRMDRFEKWMFAFLLPILLALLSLVVKVFLFLH